MDTKVFRKISYGVYILPQGKTGDYAWNGPHIYRNEKRKKGGKGNEKV